MKKTICLLALGGFLLSCVRNSGDLLESSPGAPSIIHEPRGEKPAGGAAVKFFALHDGIGKPAGIYQTDETGRFFIGDLPAGLYAVWAEKDSFVLFQDSVWAESTYAAFRDDTLECPSAVSGTVGMQIFDDPRSIKIYIREIDRCYDVSDREGNFTLSGLASGVYSLSLAATAPGYAPCTQTLTLPACSRDTLRDPWRLSYCGIPLVSGMRISQDTLAGVIRLSWQKTAYASFLDYALYAYSGKDFIDDENGFIPVRDTFYADSAYCAAAADRLDTADRPLKYRIAVRDSQGRIGPTYGFLEITRAPKSRATTFLSHRIRQVQAGCDSASRGDTLEIVLAAAAMARPLAACRWYDPLKNDTISKKTVDNAPGETWLDTIRYSFDSIGTNRILAIVVDKAGALWIDTIPVKIVKDAPIADAGSDTDALGGDAVRLHGGARQRFGSIVAWEWKIGSGKWSATSGPDTVISAPAEKQNLVCSLAVIDEDGNRATDGMTVSVSVKAKAVYAGNHHSFIVKTDGSLWACGNNDYGQLGGGIMTTRLSFVRIMPEVQSASAQAFYSLILKTDGSLLACGYNVHGQLGDGTQDTRYYLIRFANEVQSMAAGEGHSLILKYDGTLWGCGRNASGQLGDGTFTDRFLPDTVMSDVLGMAAGGFHSLILKPDNTLWACGNNYHGQLGDGTHSDRLSPVMIMTDVHSAAAGYNYSLILRTDASLWKCGFIGETTTVDTSHMSPEMILTDVRSMAAGKNHCLILKTDGSLWACGDNLAGELGDATTTRQPAPVQVMTDVQSMAAGESYSLIVKNDGTLWGCGLNPDGQLGDKTREARPKLKRIVYP